MSIFAPKIIGTVLLLLGLIGMWQGSGFTMPAIALHLAAGATLSLLPARTSTARPALLISGIVYGVVACVGFINPRPPAASPLLNPADPWLHMAIAAVCVFLGSKYGEAQAAPFRRAL